MRRSVQRVLALASFAPLLVPAAPAYAAVAPTCPDGPYPEVDFGVLGFDNRVALHNVSPTTWHVCVEVADLGEVVLVVRTPFSVTKPLITRTPGTGECWLSIVDVREPVTFSVSVGADWVGPEVCVEQNHETLTVSFNSTSPGSAPPDVQVWTTRYSILNDLLGCPEYHDVDGGPFWDHEDCHATDHQVV